MRCSTPKTAPATSDAVTRKTTSGWIEFAIDSAVGADAAAFRGRLRRCKSFGAWDTDVARAWWSEHANALAEKRAVMPSGEADSSGGSLHAVSLMTVDVEGRRF